MANEWKDKVAQNFGARALEYDDNSPVQEHIAQNLLKDFPDNKCHDILEIGCGTGLLTQLLIKKYPNSKLHITDISDNMINCARDKVGSAENITWSIMDGEAPKTDQKYDLIVANMVVQWFEDIEGGINGLRSLLKPNGKIFYTLPSSENFKEWRSVLSELDLPVGLLSIPSSLDIYNKEEIKEDYGTTLDFLRSMKKIGAHTSYGDYNALSPSDLLRACRIADQRYKGVMTWQILYGCCSA